jgi:hypothetical protein
MVGRLPAVPTKPTPVATSENVRALLTVGWAFCASRPPLRPIIGADKVARAIIVGYGKADGTLLAPRWSMGGPALLVRLDGDIDGVLAIRVEGARIAGLSCVRTPEKLARVGSETPLTR